MYSYNHILEWIYENVKPMRRSRQTTLGMVVAAAMRMKGVGVLALGRSMPAKTTAKHSIKRVWRFFRNSAIELFSIQHALIRHLKPFKGRIVILADWTETVQYKTLLLSLPRDGRALPIWWRTIVKNSGEGSQICVENQALAELSQLVPSGGEVVIAADRGFGNTRWLGEIQNRGWGYVQRLACRIEVQGPQYIGKLDELGIQAGDGAKDWGTMDITQSHPFSTRLITTYASKAQEPWYLVTNLRDIPPEIVRLYQRRMWIEEMFRDIKNRRWGLGLDDVELSTPQRQDRLWSVLAITYVFLCAFGAAAETEGIDEQLKANTEGNRVMNLARIGNYFLQIASLSITVALAALNRLPP